VDWRGEEDGVEVAITGDLMKRKNGPFRDHELLSVLR